MLKSPIIIEGMKKEKYQPIQLRLGRFFRMSSEFWLGLQSQYDLDVAADALGDRPTKEVKDYSQVA